MGWRLSDEPELDRGTSCKICDEVPARACVTTGRGEYFGPPINALEAVFRSDKDDLLRCPICTGLYFWHEDVSFYGSGSSDDETLTRVPESLMAFVRAFTQRDSDSPDELAAVTSELFRCEGIQRGLVVRYLVRHRGARVELLANYLAEDVRRNSCTFATELLELARNDPEFARHVLTAIAESPAPSLFDAVGGALCRICGRVGRATIATGDIGPRNVFLLLNRTNNDVWKCPRCDALFAWHEPVLRRMNPSSQHCLRAVLEHGDSPLPEGLMRGFLDLGDDVIQAILVYARERDDSLFRNLVGLGIAIADA